MRNISGNSKYNDNFLSCKHISIKRHQGSMNVRYKNVFHVIWRRTYIYTHTLSNFLWTIRFEHMWSRPLHLKTLSNLFAFPKMNISFLCFDQRAHKKFLLVKIVSHKSLKKCLKVESFEFFLIHYQIEIIYLFWVHACKLMYLQ